MTTTCTFRADMIITTSGGGHQRVRDVQCRGEAGHEKTGGADREHEFIHGHTHTFGASYEKGRYVTRR